ncbi:MAG TPA: hypothetical protein VM122_09490 [Usitatibacter sp.]|nr:hypothetical protein [Usitatibacter sp.]
MGKGPREVERALDELVPEYRPRDEASAARRAGRWLAKFFVAALLAVAAMAAIFYILHKHVRDAQTSAAAKRPIYIQVLPQK